jgi:hypothetical protein
MAIQLAKARQRLLDVTRELNRTKHVGRLTKEETKTLYELLRALDLIPEHGPWRLMIGSGPRNTNGTSYTSWKDVAFKVEIEVGEYDAIHTSLWPYIDDGEEPA